MERTERAQNPISFCQREEASVAGERGESSPGENRDMKEKGTSWSFVGKLFGQRRPKKDMKKKKEEKGEKQEESSWLPDKKKRWPIQGW